MSSVITLVDDDQNILTSVSMALEAEGFKIVTYKNGEEALEGFQKSLPDLAVLDMKMPRMDGMTLIKKMREFTTIPVIFLTSKDDEMDQVLGFRFGADDYITKPFSQRLLVERIRVLLRRVQIQKESSGDTEESEDIMTRGDLVLDNNAHVATWKGEAVTLSVTEYLLIKTLAERAGHVKTRDQLIDQAYGETVHVDDRTVDSHVKRLRKKFKKLDETFDRIETVYGAGYRYNGG